MGRSGISPRETPKEGGGWRINNTKGQHKRRAEEERTTYGSCMPIVERDKGPTIFLFLLLSLLSRSLVILYRITANYLLRWLYMGFRDYGPPQGTSRDHRSSIRYIKRV